MSLCILRFCIEDSLCRQFNTESTLLAVLGAVAPVPKYVQHSSLLLLSCLTSCSGNPKAAEAAGSAYYNPSNPHSVYMPMVRYLACVLLYYSCVGVRSEYSCVSASSPFSFLFPCRSSLLHMRLSQTPLTRKTTEVQAPSLQSSSSLLFISNTF